eukprot:TRINITY_DN26671_c0_g1_i2.p1 TRINITY_DN26671_c0_g1~~TRINITY_DN26671_c0_g1_i2.p1  ORF type:complete len:701 (+),score=115.86 TRINITY_DN26671_c0_g1_i2:119-2104(+)
MDVPNALGDAGSALAVLAVAALAFELTVLPASTAAALVFCLAAVFLAVLCCFLPGSVTQAKGPGGTFVQKGIRVSVVLPSGDVEAQLEALPGESITTLSKRAQKVFGKSLRALMLQDGKELDHQASIGEAGLRSNDVLLAVLVEQPIRIYATDAAFAAVRADGTVVTWGNPWAGGDCSSVREQLTGEQQPPIQHIYTNQSSFAALRGDGSIVSWGNPVTGGALDASWAEQHLCDVEQVSRTYHAFAAITGNGAVSVWGDPDSGGFCPDKVAVQLSKRVRRIYSTGYAFAAVKADGSVVTWGDEERGGDSSAVRWELTSGVQFVAATEGAFAAVKGDGSVIPWGLKEQGGKCTVRLRDAQQVYSTAGAFAAITESGSIVTWGDCYGEGSGAVGSAQVIKDLGLDVEHIYTNQVAFAALKYDGTVLIWGGGFCDRARTRLQDVQQIVSTSRAFAGLKVDGSVVAWGDPGYGGDARTVEGELADDVQQIFSTSGAFAALKSNGAVVTWGDPGKGGDSSSVAEELAEGVGQIIANQTAFVAVKGSSCLSGLPELLQSGRWRRPPRRLLRVVRLDAKNLEDLGLRTRTRAGAWCRASQCEFFLLLSLPVGVPRADYLSSLSRDDQAGSDQRHDEQRSSRSWRCQAPLRQARGCTTKGLRKIAPLTC